MTPSGWIECDQEPPHRSDANENAFLEACTGCKHQLSIDLEQISGRTFVKCSICTCPLKIIVHRYGICPAGIVPPPEIP